LKEDLVVAPGAALEPIEVLLKDGTASLEGTLAVEGTQAQGRALLVPEGSPRGIVSTPVDSDGKFRMTGLAPGRYSVVVLEDGEEVDTEDPADVERLRRLGDTVELEAESASTVTMELRRWKE